ncbi:hypothetical protein VM1G_01927 [Cytospora mali]|uniref:SMODS and SLOG-associating 2TM effector domain-containing protein n=1 Tax=Cytospora mali TaxID=578113 RepID=A0A194VNH8_CYTMA|nr:hypothetical protein VM1G_01927 [Valsa mali]
MSSQNTEAPPKPVETSPLLTSAIQPGATHPQGEQPQPPAVNTEAVKPDGPSNTEQSDHPLAKVDTDFSWGAPAGLPLRDAGDECLLIFRRAIGINNDLASSFKDGDSLEKGRKHAAGIYRHVLSQKRKRKIMHHTLGILLYLCHFVQITVAAILTSLGPNAKRYEIAITVLGAVNTVVAGVLALLKGSGVIERLAKDEVEFQKLQDWIEETESLLSVGVIGSTGGDQVSNRKAAGCYVEAAFRKYNACFGRSYEIMSTSNIEGLRTVDRTTGR